MKVIAFPVNSITLVDVVFSESIKRLELSARRNILCFVHVKEDWKCLNLVEDPVVHRSHSKLLLHSRKLL